MQKETKKSYRGRSEIINEDITIKIKPSCYKV